MGAAAASGASAVIGGDGAGLACLLRASVTEGVALAASAAAGGVDDEGDVADDDGGGVGDARMAGGRAPRLPLCGARDGAEASCGVVAVAPLQEALVSGALTVKGDSAALFFPLRLRPDDLPTGLPDAAVGVFVGAEAGRCAAVGVAGRGVPMLASLRVPVVRRRISIACL